MRGLVIRQFSILQYYRTIGSLLRLNASILCCIGTYQRAKATEQAWTHICTDILIYRDDYLACIGHRLFCSVALIFTPCIQSNRPSALLSAQAIVLTSDLSESYCLHNFKPKFAKESKSTYIYIQPMCMQERVIPQSYSEIHTIHNATVAIFQLFSLTKTR